MVPRQLIEQALEAFGERANASLAEQSRESRALLVSQFVRQLHGVGVDRLHDFERFLLVELNAAPDGMQDVLITDAISVIRARNHIGHVAKSLGMSWSDGMRLQSALCELVRHAGSNTGGLLQTTVKERRATVVLKIPLGASPPDLALLAAIEPVVTSVRTRKSAKELLIELSVDCTDQQGAA